MDNYTAFRMRNSFYPKGFLVKIQSCFSRQFNEYCARAEIQYKTNLFQEKKLLLDAILKIVGGLVWLGIILQIKVISFLVLNNP